MKILVEEEVDQDDQNLFLDAKKWYQLRLKCAVF